MGQTQSLTLPLGKNFHFSYCKKQSEDPPTRRLKEHTDLSNLFPFSFNKVSLNLIYDCILYKIKHLGYDVSKVNKITQHSTLSLKDIINSVISNGFKSKDETESLKDLIIKPKSYKVTLENIKTLLFTGNVLLAGLVVDKEFASEVLEITNESNVVLTDIVLITGYTKESLKIMTSWKTEPLYINNKFLENIIEVWNFEVESPDNYFLEKELN